MTKSSVYKFDLGWNSTQKEATKADTLMSQDMSEYVWKVKKVNRKTKMITLRSAWSVYLLYNPKLNRTYIGATTDVKRRLRQHNREIVGGARSTKFGAPDWELVCYISGFGNKSDAYKWEKLLKLRGGKGKDNRYKAFIQVSNRECPMHSRSKKRAKKYTVPKGLKMFITIQVVKE